MKKAKKLKDMYPKFQGEVKGFSQADIEQFNVVMDQLHPTKDKTAVESIQDTLDQRGKRYGSFEGNSRIGQAIKGAMINSKNWDVMEDYQREALEFIASKIGRILNGDPDYIDSWTDIAGFATLVQDILQVYKGDEF
jgi:hypothetical protein